ncbi:MAG TPA: sodium:proton antiporter [Caulobacteraceae bacterium]
MGSGSASTLPLLDLVAIFLTLTAALSWANLRFLKLPTTVGLLLIGLVGSGLVILTDYLFAGLQTAEALTGLMSQLDFTNAVLLFMLGYLLFAGALEVDLKALKGVFWTAVVLATAGVLLSTAIIGAGFWWTARQLGFDLPFPWALVFGALISPTDPVAVLAALQRVKLPPQAEALMQAESLFNDGVGVVLFGAAVSYAAGQTSPELLPLGGRVAWEALGAAAIGAMGAGVVVAAMRRIDDYGIEVALTLALATGVYALCHRLGLSGPIGVAVAGLMVGSEWAGTAMSDQTNRYVRGFWRLVDQNLNALLFLIIGLEVLVLPLDWSFAGLAAVAVVLVLFARLVSVTGPVVLLARCRDELGYGIVPVLTWGGVRGGISVALALSLPPGEARDAILTSTYVIVLVSNLVQATTLPQLTQRVLTRGGEG